MLTISEKYALMVKRKGQILTEVAEKLGMSSQNIYKKLKRGHWSDDDLKRYAEVIGCDYEVVFIDKATGDRI